MTDTAELVAEILAARRRLMVFVGRCSEEQWTSCPLADTDPRPLGVIVDHVADAYEYLATFVATLLRNEPVEVTPQIVDALNARHAAAVRAPARAAVIEHLRSSGDSFVALIEPLDMHQLSNGSGRAALTRFAEIAARHADGHRTELEAALRTST